MSESIVIKEKRLQTLIINAHRLLGAKYKHSPLWSLVSDLTGHGSSISGQICKQSELDPDQHCSNKVLKEYHGDV